MKISEIIDDEQSEILDILKYDRTVRKWINEMISEINDGVDISIIADGYISLKQHLMKTPGLLENDDELKSRLAFLKTEIIDRGGASYLSEGI